MNLKLKIQIVEEKKISMFGGLPIQNISKKIDCLKHFPIFQKK